jgi:Nucleoside-diphosphate-sugar pyrophosphorylase involved in lipopolysaccharide biosynthesis/translation initiation factor 2B, gamma/epsilon subunits (eIF-2Bgamma/eIF-2Bepsilon)
LLANTGLYLINSRVLKFLKKNKKIDMDKFLDILLKKKKKIKVFPISDLSWRDTGKWSEYSKLK